MAKRGSPQSHKGCQEDSYDLHNHSPLDRFFITMLKVDDSKYWSKLLKPASGCASARLSNLAQIRKCPPVIMYLFGCSGMSTGRFNMLWTIFVVLLILWLLGFSLHIGGGLIHLLLVVGLVVLVINLLSGRRSAV